MTATWRDATITWRDPTITWTGHPAPRKPIPTASLRSASNAGGPVLLSHPFRIDGAGRVATIPQGSAAHAAETAGHVLSCLPGERPLAPEYGMDEPVGDTTPDLVQAALTACEPDLQTDEVTVMPEGDGQVMIVVDVGWATGGES